jgi:cell division protease FtsH
VHLHRQAITDVNAWLDGLEGGVRPALRALGELLVGVAERDSAETADRFTARCLGWPTADTCSTRNANSIRCPA